MTPFLLFEYFLAVAGGIAVVGCSLAVPASILLFFLGLANAARRSP